MKKPIGLPMHVNIHHINSCMENSCILQNEKKYNKGRFSAVISMLVSGLKGSRFNFPVKSDISFHNLWHNVRLK